MYHIDRWDDLVFMSVKITRSIAVKGKPNHEVRVEVLTVPHSGWQVVQPWHHCTQGDHGCSYGAIIQWWYHSIGTLKKQYCSKPWNVFPVREICWSHCSGVLRWLEKDCQKAKFVGEVFCWHSARGTEFKHYNSCCLKKELFISGKWWPKKITNSWAYVWIPHCFR